MIVVFATVVGMTVATLSGGRFRRFAHLEMRALWVIWLTIVIQTLLFELPPTLVSDTVYAQVHMGTYAMAFLFLWLNRQIPGAVIIGLGAGSNAAAIAANGGVMPASPAACRGTHARTGLSCSSERQRCSASRANHISTPGLCAAGVLPRCARTRSRSGSTTTNWPSKP